VREWLDTDRVIIFRFRPDWQGDVITESVGEGWRPILSTTIADPCFKQHYIEPYRHGHVSVTANIDEADLEPCYIELLKPFHVKANLAVPILHGETLWGLLIAHQCSAPRQWQSSEIALVRRLATQVGIAIQQSELYEQTQRELLSREHMQAMLAEQATLLDIASDAIFVRDLDHHILYWNQGAERLYGWSAAEAVGQQVDALTRGSSGERTVVNLVEVLEEVVTMAQQSLPKAIEIQPQFLDPNVADPPLGTVFANPTQLHQVFMNLCINARDAMPEGGRLTISAQNTDVDQAMAKKHLHAEVGPYVVVTVADTGVGIEPEVRDRIFDPFFTTKASGKGTGLGLSTVFSIVKNTGGFLQVITRVGRGTAIKVFLPAMADPPEEDCPENETTPADSSSQAKGHGELILVVDDDETVQQTIQSLLETHHYTTQVARDGVEALERYQRFQDRIRLVVLDINMPHMGGIELIQRLKSMNPAVHIIAISGLPTNQESSLKAGANVFLSKPYSLEAFIAQVESLLTD
jgi:signal transduction histidine kinase